MPELVIWVDDFAVATLPGLEKELAHRTATVMRSFSRTPNPLMVAQFAHCRQAAVVGGRDFNDLVARIERATTFLRIPVIGALPPRVPESEKLHGPGLVDLIPAGSPSAAARVILMSEVPIISGPNAARRPSAPAPPPRALPGPADALPVVAIASSTGGTWVLAELLRSLDRARVGPLLLAQHMDAEFVPFFARWLKTDVGWDPVVVAEPTPLRGDRIYLADGGRDLCVGADGQHLHAAPASSRFVPSADRLFRTCAAYLGARAIGVVLSGMGTDGAEGLAELVRRGGRGICQRPSTAIVASMPESALRSAAGAVAVEPAQIPAWLTQAAGSADPP